MADMAIGVSPRYCVRKAGMSITSVWNASGGEKGLKVPVKQPKHGCLWLNDGSIVRLRAEFPKHVWSYDFMEDRTHNGVKFRILNIIDEFTRECLAVRVGRSLTHQVVIDVLTELSIERGVPVHLRSDNGSEFTAKRVQSWLKRLDVKPLFIEPGSPWENGYVESFNGKMRDELLTREIFYSLREAQVLIEMWRKQYNTVRPHSALGYRPGPSYDPHPTCSDLTGCTNLESGTKTGGRSFMRKHIITRKQLAWLIIKILSFQFKQISRYSLKVLLLNQLKGSLIRVKEK